MAEGTLMDGRHKLESSDSAQGSAAVFQREEQSYMHSRCSMVQQDGRRRLKRALAPRPEWKQTLGTRGLNKLLKSGGIIAAGAYPC